MEGDRFVYVVVVSWAQAAKGSSWRLESSQEAALRGPLTPANGVPGFGLPGYIREYLTGEP
jgi:hypothetical protein